jgi:hypothetical protein
MASLRPYSFLRDVLVRVARFFYLLWGGMLLGTLVYYDRIRLPDWVWNWPQLARYLTGPWGRGIFLGLALGMLVAALVEVWELVDLLLVRLMHDHDH